MSTSITEKTYKKLTIQVSLNGFGFLVTDTILTKPQSIKHIHFNSFEKSHNISDLYASVFAENEVLTKKYDEVKVIHSNNLCTFVPFALFDEAYLGSYLQYNTKVFDTDFFTYDKLEKYEMNTVYVPYVNMNNFFIDRFGSFEYQHASTVLVAALLDKSKNIDERRMFVHKSENHFEIVVIQNQKLLFFNTFEYSTPEDFIYFILFTAEQLHLNPEHFVVTLLGDCKENDSYYEMVYKYIRNVSLLDVSGSDNTLTEAENREHFILLHA